MGEQEFQKDEAGAANAVPVSTLHLKEERLDLQTSRHTLTDVQLKRERREVVQTFSIPIEWEELVVYQDGVPTHRFKVSEERVEFHKVPVELEHVKVYLETVEGTAVVTESLKREQLRIETVGAVRVEEH